MTNSSLAETQLGRAGTRVDLGALSQSDGSHVQMIRRPAGKEEAGRRGERQARAFLTTEPQLHPAPRRAFLQLHPPLLGLVTLWRGGETQTPGHIWFS